MKTNTIAKTEGRFIRRILIAAAGITFFITDAAMASDPEQDKQKSAADYVHNECHVLKQNTDLTNSVHVKMLSDVDWAALAKATGLDAEDITQIKIRTYGGEQYFFVRKDGTSYVCKPEYKLPVTLFSIEPATDVVYQVNPCCTSTTGGDAQAQWFNLTYCPLYKPTKRPNYVCGR